MIGQPKRSSAEGNFGILFLTFAENIFPPVPSEIIIPVAGLVVAREQLSSIGIVLAGTIGSLAGALFWDGGPIESAVIASRPFARAAERLVPGARTLISVPAGVAGMAHPLSPLHIPRSAALDRALRRAGYVLAERYREVGGWIEPAGNASPSLTLGV